MAIKKSYLTVTDQFCGAGGSSQGVRRLALRYGGGIEVALALNHWKLAIATHNTNFPDTIHDCTDVSACDPRRYPSTDILITSPECTNHSLAKGVRSVAKQIALFDKRILDPAVERSRATMWDVPRFAECHRYNAIIVENVVDARRWIMFDAWLMAMHALGYRHKCVYINSMHCHPTPQSRDRMYVIFWKKGNKAPNLDFHPIAFCVKCCRDVHAVQTWKDPSIKYGKYRKQYVYCCPGDGFQVEPYYYAAFNCIDWTNIGYRIGDRKKPLSPSTIRRIEYGLKKYANQPFLSINFTPGYCKSLHEACASITTQDHHGLVAPFILKTEHAQQVNLRSALESLQTQTTCQSMGLVVPSEPMSNHPKTSCTAGHCYSTATSDCSHSSLVTTESWNSFIASYYNGSHCTQHITEATGTVTTGDRHSLLNYQAPNIEDCYYRMLKASEVKLAMAFDTTYTVLGSSKDQVRQLGNAVTPPVMEWLMQRVVESLDPVRSVVL